MLRSTRGYRYYCFHALVLSIVAVAATVSYAGNAQLVREPVQHHQLDLISGKSIVLRTTQDIKRISVASPEIADFIQLSPKEFYITGKNSGTTNMILWCNGEVFAIYDISVEYDISTLKKKLFELFPDEKDIKVIRTNSTITLSGRVSTPSTLSGVLSVARSYAPEGNVVNLLEVGGVHQVMLEVRLAEMSRSTAKNLGIDFSYSNGQDFVVSMLSGLQEIVSLEDNPLYPAGSFGVAPTSEVNLLFQFGQSGNPWSMIIDALKEEGLAKILAEPNLISLSGQTASFLAGGEFPVPVPDQDGISISYKTFGVGLSFTPMVLSPDKINIQVNSSVSELDFTTAVRYSGYVVPGLTTRNAATVVELGDGQSFAIAGLLQETIREESAKYPFLGDIPVLGALFRSTSFQKDETELVIVVTPRLVKPMDLADVSLPTDYYREPNDMEFFFNTTQIDLRTGRQPSDNPVTGTLDGDFGHSFSDSE